MTAQAWGLSPIFENIPAELRGGKWCTWIATPRPGKPGKTDKIPTLNGLKISTAHPEQFCTFDQAFQDYMTHPGSSGIGRLVLPTENLVVGDLDNGESWPFELPHSYEELSPSGNGRHRFWITEEKPERDIFKPVEMYSGWRPRFITVTGHRVNQLGVVTVGSELRQFVVSHAKANEPTPIVPMPALEEISPGQMHESVLRLDMYGWQGGDRSAELYGLVSNLYKCGYSDAQVLTQLWESLEVRALALEHRRDDPKRALAYLWGRCCKCRSKAPGAKAMEGVLPQAETATTPTAEVVPIRGAQAEAAIPENLLEGQAALCHRELLEAAKLENHLTRSIEINRIKSRYQHVGISARAVDLQLSEILRGTGNLGLELPKMSEDGKALDHTDNVVFCMKHFGYSIRHNMMSHNVDIIGPTASAPWVEDDYDNAVFNEVENHMVELGIPRVRSKPHVAAIAAKLENSYHPFKDYLMSLQWDGHSRLQHLFSTVQVLKQDIPWRDEVLKRWLLSFVAILFGTGRGSNTRHPRGVLVFAGAQYTGKTMWLRNLMPSDDMFGEGLNLNPHNKDSLKQSVKYMLVELGELDGTFRKADIAALKAHISARYDELRLPYATTESKWPRRTIYAGTVNDPEYLQDATGNTRFWTVVTTKFHIDRMVSWRDDGTLAQIWAELVTLYRQGEPWWLDDNWMTFLEAKNEEHRDFGMVMDLLQATFNVDAPSSQRTWMTFTEVTSLLGLNNSAINRKDLRYALRSICGQTKPLSFWRDGQSRRGWKMPPPYPPSGVGMGEGVAPVATAPDPGPLSFV